MKCDISIKPVFMPYVLTPCAPKSYWKLGDCGLPGNSNSAIPCFIS